MRPLYGTVMLLSLVVFTESCSPGVNRNTGHGTLPNTWRNSEMPSNETTRSCSAGILTWLSPHEMKQCKLYVSGIANALDQCQTQLKNRRWNCSGLNSKQVIERQKILKTDTRESAFVFAITSAGVLYKFLKQCTHIRRDLNCSCKTPGEQVLMNQTGEGVWERPICTSYNGFIKYAEEVSRRYTDPKPSKEDERSLLIKHNNEVGRKTVIDLMLTKCHVLGGFVYDKFCWRGLPEFGAVAKLLREKFDYALQVRLNAHKTKLETRWKNVLPISGSNLVYTKNFPSFCQAIPSLGIMGTRGRLCKKSGLDTDGCVLMCCGRGYTTVKRSIKVKCNCTFEWCCIVQCQLCNKVAIEHRCE